MPWLSIELQLRTPSQLWEIMETGNMYIYIYIYIYHVSWNKFNAVNMNTVWQIVKPIEAEWRIHAPVRLANIHCRFSANLLPEAMQAHSKLGVWGQNLMKFESKYSKFYIRNCIWKCCVQNGGHFIGPKMVIVSLESNREIWDRLLEVKFRQSIVSAK